MTPGKPAEPDIWLQENEANGSADCGCILSESGPDGEPGAAFYYCPLHAAAGALLKACKAARISLIDDETYAQFRPLVKTLEEAIAKATPPKASEPGWFA